eukprot:48422-Eustigmatos_ZCMA.PRE.1
MHVVLSDCLLLPNDGDHGQPAVVQLLGPAGRQSHTISHHAAALLFSSACIFCYSRHKHGQTTAHRYHTTR